MDLYTEQLYRKRKTAGERILQILIITGCLGGSAALIYFFRVFAPAMGTAAAGLIVIIFAFFAMKNQWFQQFDREFEYLYYNGDIDIDRITAKSSRKRIISFKAKDVLRYGVYRESVKSKIPFDKIIDVTSGYETENTVCFLSLRHRQMGTVLLIFEPKDEIRDDMKRRVQVPFEG